MNKKYKKGTRYEREIVNAARAEGKIAFRTAGSHSIVDVCIIDMENLEIEFIQAKTGKAKMKKEDKALFEELDSWKHDFTVNFKEMIRIPKKRGRK